MKELCNLKSNIHFTTNMLTMKRLICLICLIASCGLPAIAQIYNPKQAAKSKVENRANNKVDQAIDNSIDKVENGIKGIFKKKKKKEQPAEEQTTTEPATTENTSNSNNTPAAGTGDGSIPAKTPSMKSYSKFDFVSGEKVLYYENFEEAAIGDFLEGWNTNSTAEIVRFDELPGKWLSMTKDGYFQPDLVTNMPDNFTLEFDLFNRYVSSNILRYHFIIGKSANPRADIGDDLGAEAAFAFSWSPCSGTMSYLVTEKDAPMGKNDDLKSKNLMCSDHEQETPVLARVSLWRQKNRLRIYINEEKVLDVPQAFNSTYKYNVFKWKASYMNFANGRSHDDQFMVANLKYAVGAPDTRNKLITLGKFSTTGILFDVNSDKIKPSSYGTMKEIATVLKENATVKIKIIGHTDSDGDEQANLTLSKNRAAAVKAMLTEEFGIDGERIQTDGKGESMPAEPNTSAQGKANNRRVEFIKL